MRILSKNLIQKVNKKRALSLFLSAYVMGLIFYYCIPKLNSDMSERKNIVNKQDYNNAIQSARTSELILRLIKINKCLSESYDNDVYDENVHQKSQRKIFPPSPSKMISSFDHLRISGFEFCSILNNARFDPWVHICKFLFGILC